MATFAQLSKTEQAELWSCLALRHSKGLGVARAKKILAGYYSAYEAVQACLHNAKAWVNQGLCPAIVANAFATEHWREKALEEWQELQQGHEFLLWSFSDYPRLLLELPDSPLILYVKGDASLLHNPIVSVVGARQCTHEGLSVAAFFSRDLSKAGVTVISGMAMGIDRVAHLAGLEGCGKTIAVLGTGINVVYPLCNSDLAKAIEKEGLLISEFPPSAIATAKNFPIRNRLISGLARGVLVVEAAQRSGSLITARLALEQGREVFAVPGHTMAVVSAGCRELIRKGAKAVFNADDILAELAPLLTFDARQALQQRQEQGVTSTADARNRFEQDYSKMQEEAVEVLPKGALPWKAPQNTSKKLKKSISQEKKERRNKPDVSVQKRAEGISDGKNTGYKNNEEQTALTVQNTTEMARPITPLSADEERIVQLLCEKVHIDVLSRELLMDVATLSGMLTILEMQGVVSRSPGMYYIKTG